MEGAAVVPWDTELSPVPHPDSEERGERVPGVSGVCGELPFGFSVQFRTKKKEKSHNMLQVGGLEAVDELLMSIIPVFPLEVGG